VVGWNVRRRIVPRLEARVRIELTMEVLQTSALPLGYRARSFFAAFAGTPLSKNETLKQKALRDVGL
jgi:hypothetical protein